MEAFLSASQSIGTGTAAPEPGFPEMKFSNDLNLEKKHYILCKKDKIRVSLWETYGAAIFLSSSF
jgi:hypothetical protein